MNSACQPRSILEKKLVLFAAAGTGVAVGEAKMSPRLPGVAVGVAMTLLFWLGAV